ncbi:MAG TPA: alpha/beta hydrolase [Rubrivivax sp.]|nr:alpha/beta hydrolase [Rubrivivax sp.]
MSRLPAFTQHGTGDTAVLLLHGIGGGQAIWEDGASGTGRALEAAGYAAFSIDLPGYGGSATMGPPDMDSLVAGVMAVIRHATARQTVLVGHSMGGMIAQELTAREPWCVQGLVLACTSAAFGGGGPDAQSWQARFVGERLAPLDAGLGMAAMAQRLVPGMVSPVASAGARQLSIDVMSRVPESTYRAALKTIVAFDRREALAKIGVPTLLLAAEEDRTAPPDMMQRMARRIGARAQYVCLPNAGHIANVEAPAAFNAAVLRFLEEHFAGT